MDRVDRSHQIYETLPEFLTSAKRLTISQQSWFLEPMTAKIAALQKLGQTLICQEIYSNYTQLVTT